MLENKKIKRITGRYFLIATALMFLVMIWQSFVLAGASSTNLTLKYLLSIIIGLYSLPIYCYLSMFLRENNLSDGQRKCEECKKKIGCFKKCYPKMMNFSLGNQNIIAGYGYPGRICKTCHQIKKLKE
jgi:hypothetical protein